jgi:hypothetical protein
MRSKTIYDFSCPVNDFDGLKHFGYDENRKLREGEMAQDIEYPVQIWEEGRVVRWMSELLLTRRSNTANR